MAALLVLHQRLLLCQQSSLLLSSLATHEMPRHNRHLSNEIEEESSSAGGARKKGDPATADRRSSPVGLSPAAERSVAGMMEQQQQQQQSPPILLEEDEDDSRWLTMRDFDVYLDAFSDSWYVSLDTFQETDDTRLREIEAVEEACFVVFEDREERVRMATDWLDFAVEHMSRWWKVLEVPQNEYAHRRVLQYLDRHAERRMRSVRRHRPPSYLRSTVALVAFQRYQVRGRGDDEDEANVLLRRSRKLTVSSLAATVASLVGAGMGRVVVVGHDAQEEADSPIVHEAFARIATAAINDNTTTPTAINDQWVVVGGTSQLAYVTVPDGMVRTDFVPANVPRGALLGLRRALEGTDPAWTLRWLGPTTSGARPWRSVYLTEPDTILHARPARFVGMERMLRDGLILVPHRLQPVPYEGDFPDSNRSHTYVSVEQPAAALSSDGSAHVLELDAAASTAHHHAAACCDEQMGTFRPGPKAASEAGLGARCGWDRWWLCGFDQPSSNGRNSSHPRPGNHSLILDHYRLIRLAQGTGVTLVSGSSHGRRCIPTLNGTCARRPRPPATQQAQARPKNPWITPKRLQERRMRSQNASNAMT